MFDVGDTVRRENSHNNIIPKGTIGVVSSVTNEGREIYLEKYSGSFLSEYFSLVSKKSTESAKKSMSLVSKARNLLRSEPEKSFVKAGVMDDNANLTEEGKQLFLEYLFEKNKASFNTDVVQKLIAEDENESK